MKILYIGVFNQPHCSDIYRLNGFINAGFEVSSIDFREREKEGHLQALEIIYSRLRDFQPDVVFVNKGETLTAEDIKSIRKDRRSNSIWFLWYGDDFSWHISDAIKNNFRLFDALLVKTDDDFWHHKLMEMGAKKVFFYMDATDPDVFYRHDPVSIDREFYNIVWFGNLQTNIPLAKLRKVMLENVCEKFNNVVLFGASKALRDIGRWDGVAYGSSFAVAASKAKILLGININNKMMHYNSNRLWNSMACGFTLYNKFPGIEDMFENHKHLVWWETLDELNELIKFYLKNNAAREWIFKNGRKLIEEKHTYYHRAFELRKIYDGIKNDKN